MIGRNASSFVLGDVSYTVAGCYLSIVAVAATLGNSLIVLTFVRNAETRKKCHNILLFNLAVADLAISFFGYPFVTVSTLYGQWMFTDAGCKTYAFFTFFFSIVSLNTLVFLSAYRYVIVCKPSHKHYLNKRTTMGSICCSWAYSLFWAIMPFFGWSSYTYEAFGTSCTINWTDQNASAISYDVTVIVTCFLLHLVVLVFCYQNIIKKACALVFDRRNPSEFSEGFNRKYMRKQFRISMMCFVMVFSFFVCWGPYAAFSFVTIFMDVSPALATVPTFMAKAAPMSNSVIYFFMNRKFRNSFYRSYCCCLYNAVTPNSNYVNTFAKYYPSNKTVTLFGTKTVQDKEGVYIGQEPEQIYQCHSLQDEFVTNSTNINSPIATIKPENEGANNAVTPLVTRLKASLYKKQKETECGTGRNELPLLDLLKADIDEHNASTQSSWSISGKDNQQNVYSKDDIDKNSSSVSKAEAEAPDNHKIMLPDEPLPTLGTDRSWCDVTSCAQDVIEESQNIGSGVSRISADEQMWFAAANRSFSHSLTSLCSASLSLNPRRRWSLDQPMRRSSDGKFATEIISSTECELNSHDEASTANVKKYSRHLGGAVDLDDVFYWL